mgnify:CR=1 FL=1
MANSANPEINKKIATSALGTLVIATVFFYLGDRYAETLVTYPGQIFDHLSDAFLSMWQTIKDAPFALDMTSNSLLFGGACFLIIWMIWLRYVAFIGNYRSGEESGSARWGTVKEIPCGFCGSGGLLGRRCHPFRRAASFLSGCKSLTVTKRHAAGNRHGKRRWSGIRVPYC